MIIVLAALAALLIAQNFLSLYVASKQFERERASWAVERHNLLRAAMTAKPVEIPQAVREPVPHVIPEDEAELAMVGQIVWGEADE